MGTNHIYQGCQFDTDRHFACGSVHPGNLSGFGQEFVKTGFLRGYGYVRGGVTGHFGKKVNATRPRWAALRAALESGNLEAIARAAKALPSVRVNVDTRYPGNGNYGFTVAWKGCNLFTAPFMSKV